MRIQSLRRPLALLTNLVLAASSVVVLAQEPLPVTVPQPAPPPDASQAQPAPEISMGRKPQRGDVQKVFVTQHVQVRDLAQVLAVFPATIERRSTGATAGLLAVSAPPAVLAAIEETIKRLDVPPPPQKTVEITASIIEASAGPSGGPDMPAHLQAVVKQLRQSLDFASYRLLDTLVARMGEGANFKVSGILARRMKMPQTERHSLECNEVAIVGAPPARVVRLRGLKYGAKIVAQTYGTGAEGQSHVVGHQLLDVGFGAQDSLSIRPDQQAVIGKFSISESGDALILVLSARIVD